MLTVETQLKRLIENISSMSTAVSKLEEFQGHVTDAVKTVQNSTQELQTRAGVG